MSESISTKQKLRVGLVVVPYEESMSSGMGYSVLETAKQLAAHAGEYELTLYSSKPLDTSLLPGTYKNVLIPKTFVGQFWYFFWMKKEVDLLFFIVALLPFWISSKINTVVVCKDLSHYTLKSKRTKERIKVYIRDRLLMPHCIMRAKFVLVSSMETREDVMKYYKVPSERIRLIYEGYQEWDRFKATSEQGWEDMQPFFFFAGRIKRRKNVHGIVDAFIQYKKNTRSNAKLVLSGDYGGPYVEQMQKALADNSLTSDVFFLSYVTPGQMHWLYSHARAFVFPSLREGFGMPLVEAMVFGVPSITSKDSPMAEISEGAAELVDPYNTAEIAAAMERVWSNETLRSNMIAKGKERAQLYSWDKVGEKYQQVIELFKPHA